MVIGKVNERSIEIPAISGEELHGIEEDAEESDGMTEDAMESEA